MYNIYVVDNKKNILNLNGYTVGYFDINGYLHDTKNNGTGFHYGKYGKLYNSDEKVIGSFENKILCILKSDDILDSVSENHELEKYESLEYENPYFEKRTYRISELLREYEDFTAPVFEITEEKIKINFSNSTELENLLKHLFKEKYNMHPLEMFKPQEYDNPYGIPEETDYYDPLEEYYEK